MGLRWWHFLTGLSRELNYRASRLGEFVYGLLQSFRRASRIGAGNTLDGMAQQVRDVVLVYLSPSQLCSKSTTQVARSDRLQRSDQTQLLLACRLS